MPRAMPGAAARSTGTDRAGCYEVGLPADVYVVECQDAEAWTATLRVLPGERGLVVDFELPL